MRSIMSSSTIHIVITGASRGLGFEIVKQLCQHPPAEHLVILACARNIPLDDSISMKGQATVKWCTLDTTDPTTISALAGLAREACPGGVDILINNAGVNLDFEAHLELTSAAKQTMATNYNGTLNMMVAFLPLMRRPGNHQLGKSRIVNLSSVGSKLSVIPSSDLRKAIRNAHSLQEISDLRDGYLDSVFANGETQAGWPRGKSYCVSKALVNATTQVLAVANSDILINACCPGWCQTDMGNLVGPPSKTPADGAKIPLKLAFGQITESGKYWENASVHDTADGMVAEWYVAGGS